MNNNSLKVGHLNIRSLFTGFLEFKTIFQRYDFDVFFLTETWLSGDDGVDIFDIPGYRMVHRDRLGSRGGGVAAYIRHNLSAELVTFDFNVTDYLEYLTLKLKLKNKYYVFCVFYRPPNTNFNAIKNDFDNIFSSIYPSVDEIICFGDFNINLLNLDNPLTTLFENYNFIQIINEPTRISRAAVSLLDPIFVTNESMVTKSEVVSVDEVSDHCLVYCCLKIEKSHKDTRIITHRNYTNFNINLFLQDLSLIQWDEIFYENYIDNKITLFNNFLLSLFNKHAPLKDVRVTKPRAPWITPNIKLYMKQRDRALQDFKKTRSVDNWENYKRLRNFTVSLIRREKRQCLNSACAQNNPRKTWKSLRSFNLCSDKQSNNIPTNLSDPNEISAYFGRFLQDVSECDTKLNFYESNYFLNNNAQFSFRVADISETHKIIQSIHTDALGADNVNIKMLKYCTPFIDKYITHIINCCIEANYFPDQWKVSIGKPLPKIKNPQSFGDLRIISILPALSKIFEKILYKQLYHYCISNNIIPESQCGFRQYFSTSVALVGLTDDIIHAIDKKLHTALVLLDFSKAFDTINHALLLAKLKYYGFSRQAINLVESYFFNRFQRIVCNNASSEQVQIYSGVPQGSILGPLFFIIYTADILSSLRHCKIQAYADDTQIYFHFKHSDYEEASDLINEDLNILKQLSLQHNLKLNPLKSFLMIFGPKNNKQFLNDSLNVCLDGVRLPVVSSTKNLGIILDTELRFKEYVKSLIQKSYLSLKILYNDRHILNYSLRRMLCESLVLSNFNYCDFIYGPCLDLEDRNRIQKVQNTCTRLILDLRKYDHVSHLFEELNWLKMENRRAFHLGNFTMKILKNPILPSSIRDRFVFRVSVHSRDVRCVDSLTVPRHRTAMFQRSFTYNGIKFYNSLPNEFSSLEERKFRREYRAYLFSAQCQNKH